MCTLVIARNCNVNVSQWRVSIAQRNNWHVDICSLPNWLMVGPWVCDHQQPWFTESGLNLISERSWGETTGNWCRSSVMSELQHSTLSIGPSRDHTNISWILNRRNGTSSQQQLLPRSSQINYEHTIISSLENILLHLEVQLSNTDMSMT